MVGHEQIDRRGMWTGGKEVQKVYSRTDPRSRSNGFLGGDNDFSKMNINPVSGTSESSGSSSGSLKIDETRSIGSNHSEVRNNKKKHKNTKSKIM